MSDLPKSQVIGLLVKVIDTNGSYITLGPLYRINKTSDSSHLRATLLHYLESKGSTYQKFDVSELIFQYIYLNSNITDIPKIVTPKPVNYKTADYNYPLSTDLTHWGTERNKSKGSLLVIIGA